MTLPLDSLNAETAGVARAYLTQAGVPGASVTVVSGDRIYHLSHGVKAVSTGAPVTADTSFPIASCSKAFASAAMASLVADGLASWDDPVSKHLPEFKLYDPEVTAKVTLRDLAGNRLGLPREGLVEFGLAKHLAPEENFERLQYTQPAHLLRTKATYVNPGHTAIAVIAGRIAGKSFVETLRERVLAPLGMTGTSGGARAPSELADLAAMHIHLDGQVVEIETAYSDLDLGSNGMFVSGVDAGQWLRLHLNGGLVDGKQVIPRDALKETHKPQITANPGEITPSLVHPGAHLGAYALGWAVADLDGVPLVTHSGGELGACTITMLFPRQGVGVAVYLNSLSLGIMPVSYAIAASVLGLPARDWFSVFAGVTPQPQPRPPRVELADLTPYLGRFVHPGDGPLVISVENGAPVARLTDGYKAEFRMIPLGDHTFELDCFHNEMKGLAAIALPRLRFDVTDGRASAAHVQFTASRTFLRTGD